MILRISFHWRALSRTLRIFLAVLLPFSLFVAMGGSSLQTSQPPKPLANFTDIAKEAGLTMMNVFGGETTKKYIIETTGTGVAIFDYDNDGWEDLYVTYYGKNILYHNNGNGTFTDVSDKAGVGGSGKAWGTGCAFIDYDRDGHLDLMVSNYVDFDLSNTPAPGERASCIWKGVPVMCGPQGLSGSKNVLYHNRGNGTFEDVTKKAHIDQTTGHYSFSVTTLDFDDVTYRAGLGLNTQYLGWGTMFLDFDNDTWPDLLLVNGHVYPEVDSQHLGSNFQEPRILYHNNGDGKFTDISATGGPGITKPSSSRGLAIGDLWNDGRMSAVVSNMNAPPSLLVNQVHTANHWVAFRLIGTKSNRDAIGARIRVKAGSRILVDEVRSGSSFDSNNDMRVHFGLGAAAKIDWVEVRWPTGLLEKFENIKVDGVRTIQEGTGSTATSESKKHR